MMDWEEKEKIQDLDLTLPGRAALGNLGFYIQVVFNADLH